MRRCGMPSTRFLQDIDKQLMWGLLIWCKTGNRHCRRQGKVVIVVCKALWGAGVGDGTCLLASALA